jgi:RIO kinase 1
MDKQNPRIFRLGGRTGIGFARRVTANPGRKPKVSDYDSSVDKYEAYEELFNPLFTDRNARRRRKPRAKHVPKKPQRQVVYELAEETAGLEGGFTTTYHPSRYEEGWLLSSLRSFYDRGLISDILGLVKGGKEASVYRCQTDAEMGSTVLAAKVYRPRKFRNLRNDSMYRQGRAILNPYGQDHDYARDQRVIRAIGKKTAFGMQVAHTSWLMHEYTALECLYNAGAAVPRPVASSENAILMSYHGDDQLPAPTLLEEVLRNIDMMLQHNLIHGDLSAFNILYWEGEITLIDFPQVSDLHTNDNAFFILQRDIQRVCEYFKRQGVECDPTAIMEERWYLYGRDG